MVEHHGWAPMVRAGGLTGVDADAYPRDLASDVPSDRLCTRAADPDHCVERPGADSAHAVMVAKRTGMRIGIAVVRALVDQRRHWNAPLSQVVRRDQLRAPRLEPDKKAVGVDDAGRNGFAGCSRQLRRGRPI